MKQLMFKYFILCVLYFLFGFIGFAQNKAFTSSFLDFKDKNYYEIISERDSYWQQKLENNEVLSKEEAKEHKFYMRWKAFWENRLDENGGFTGPFKAMAQEKEMFDNAHNQKTANPSWTPIGPYGIDVSGSEIQMDALRGGIGAIHAVAYDPNNDQTIYAASIMGGLFKTTNGGDYWWNISDNYVDVYGGVKDIIVDPNNSNNIYVTLSGGQHGGWAMFHNYYAYGAIHSWDGGSSWTPLNNASSTHPFELDPNNGGKGRFIEDILLHPTNGKLYMLISENAYADQNVDPEESYILESNAGSNSWVKIKTFTGRMTTLRLLPANNDIFYVSGIGGLYEYNFVLNTTQSHWTSLINAFTGLPNVFVPDRAFVETTNNDNNIVYIYATKHKNGSSLDTDNYFIKFNHSTSTFITPATKIVTSGNFLTAGGTYDIRVPDNDKDKIYISKGYLFYSDDNGTTFQRITNDDSNVGTSGNLHNDFNDMDFSTNSDKMIIGNDGGLILRDQDPLVDENKYISGCGLLIAKAYSLWLDERYENSLLIGVQDGCSAYLNSLGNWQTVGCVGDDGMSMISPSGDLSYSTQSKFTTQSSLNGQLSWNVNGINRQREFHPNLPEEEVFGSNQYGIRIRSDITGIYERYSPFFGNRDIPVFDINEYNSDVCYAYAVNGDRTSQNLYRGYNGQSQMATDWPATNLPGVSPQSKATRLLSHPLSENILWITYGGFNLNEKVYFSDDGGTTWVNHSLGIPNIPVNSIIMDKNSGMLYIGTDLGVYYKDSKDGPSVAWNPYGVSFPRGAMTSEIRINHTYNKIVAATFGRGVWEAPLICDNNVLALPSSFHFYYNAGTITGNTTQDITKSAVLRANDRIVLSPGFKTAPTGRDIFSAKIISCYSNGVQDPCSSYMRYAESTSDNNEGIEEFRAGINIFPNPNNGVFNINMETQHELTTVLVLNSVGKVVRNKKLLGSNPVIDISDQPKGIYFVKISSENKVKVEKIVYQ